MRDTELQLLVFYEYKEITHPAAFVRAVLNLWEQEGFDPFQLYTRSTPAQRLHRSCWKHILLLGKLIEQISRRRYG